MALTGVEASRPVYSPATERAHQPFAARRPH
jgi:hypothetical protein